MTIAMYGDSYIKRLQDYCDGDLRVPATICWFGKGGLRSDFKDRKGLKIGKDAKSNYEKMKKLLPDVVFINVGGNDLTTTTKPREIYDQIAGLIYELQQAGVKEIYVAEILTRGDFSKCPDPDMNKASFDLQRKKINTLLAKEFKEKFIEFPDIQYPTDYLTDRVHLMDHDSTTRNTGLKKFESTLRRIICSLKH